MSRQQVVTAIAVGVVGLGITLALAWSYRTDLLLYLVRSERERLAKDPLGRVVNYVETATR